MKRLWKIYFLAALIYCDSNIWEITCAPGKLRSAVQSVDETVCTVCWWEALLDTLCEAKDQRLIHFDSQDTDQIAGCIGITESSLGTYTVKREIFA